ncbi:MAG: methyl-accepting chemotaxis protein [Gammaproteobacteria bacterium]|nr:methyl-accepting chemotaxis protein [Gammaproteobacteria bacterium]MCW9030407.1 methyl-accepting chemotaxis protein [Gammaproteobacteria bacterium]
MLNNMRIGPRLVLLIAVQTIVLGIIGVTAVLGLNFATDTTQSLNKNVIEQVTLNQLNGTVRTDILEMVTRVANGKIDFTQGSDNLLAAKNIFVNNWDEYKEDKSDEEKKEIEASLGNEYRNILTAFTELETLFAVQDKVGVNEFLETRSQKIILPFLTELNERVNEYQLISEALFEESINTNKLFFNASAAIMAIGLIFAILLGYIIYRSIYLRIESISDTVHKVSEGDYYARTGLSGKDELCELGSAFDGLLAEKVSTLVQAEQANEELNTSVITLLEAVSKLSQRDLTIRVPVTEDVTGPVADALNLFTAETSKVLKGVRVISEEVARATNLVKNQSDIVIAVAIKEQSSVLNTTKELQNASHAMEHIADLARSCNQEAENAIKTTHTAMETVTRSSEGMNTIRETIHKAEKRIKRLGERSQEISRAVNLINSISERTHILALNASMHAASAGEAGRGFAVVADEVQRLAENARDATSQISTLVSNIQIETVDTVDTMNNVITQVVEGSQLAEKAGEQMRLTQDSTEGLVASVKQIATSSADQVIITKKLQSNASQILSSNQKTSEQLQKQTIQTKRLVEYAKGLLKAVQVFKLPGVAPAEVIKAEAVKSEIVVNEKLPEIIMSTTQQKAS